MSRPRCAIWLAVLTIVTFAASPPASAIEEAAWQAIVDEALEAEGEGRIEDAERLWIDARRASETDPTARMLHALSIENLADFYYRTDRPTEAEPLFVRSVELWHEILGPEQPRVGIPLHNLAVLYLDDCRVDEAMPLIDRVLMLWASSLRPDHPDRVNAIRTEAALLRRCGREDAARAVEARGPTVSSVRPE